MFENIVNRIISITSIISNKTTIKEIIIYASLALFLFVGIYLKEKIKSFKDYALGSKPYSKLAMSATLVATLIGGGSTIGTVGMIYESGLIYVFAMALIPIGYIAVSIFVVPRFAEYYGHYTLPQMLETMYGKNVRKFTGIIGYLMLLGALAMQVKGLSIVFDNIIGDRGIFNAIIAFLVITAYTSIGGVGSVIKTDIVQFFIFMIILPIITFIIIKENGGDIQQLVVQVPKESFVKDITMVSFMGLIIHAFLPDDSPDFVHRMLIGRSTEKNRMAINIQVLIGGLAKLMVFVIAAVALIKFPSISGDNAIFVVVKNCLKNEVLFTLFGVALVSIIVSTADSLMNTSSLIFVNDVLSKKMGTKQKLLFAKIVSWLTGLFAIAIAIKSKRVIDIILFFSQFYSSVIFAPFFLGLFFQKKRPEMYWASTISGLLSYGLLRVTVPSLDNGIFLISLTISMVFYWIFSSEKVSIKCIKKKIEALASKADEVVTNNVIPINKLGYASLPISFFVLTLNIADNTHTNSYLINISVIVAGIVLALIDPIFEKKKKYKSLFSLVVFWYCFPFYSAYLYFCQNTTTMFAFNFLITMLLLAGLYNWENIVLNVILGYVISAVAFILVNTPIIPIFAERLIVLLIVLSYIGVLSFVILRRHKEGIKEILNRRAMSLTQDSIKKEEELIKHYKNLVTFTERHFVVKGKYSELIKKESFVNEGGVVDNATLEEIKKDLEGYFKLESYKREVEYNITLTSKQNSLNLNVSKSLIYVIFVMIVESIFDIIPHKSKLSITVEAVGDMINTTFKVSDFFMDFEEALRYQNEGSNKLKRIEGMFETNSWLFSIKDNEVKTSIFTNKGDNIVYN